MAQAYGAPTGFLALSLNAATKSSQTAKKDVILAGRTSCGLEVSLWYRRLVAASSRLHVFGELPAFATTTAVTSGVCWRLPSKVLQHAITHPVGTADSKYMYADNDLALDIASGLAAEVFRLSNSYSTPLFEQPAQKVNVAAVSVAAAFESYYRSALNAFLNASIQSTMAKEGASAAAATAAKGTGITLAKMFPEMHVQIHSFDS